MSEMNYADILKALPHRYPFLLVDKVIECDDKENIVAIKNVTFNEPFFQGHFPGNPVMPGVLQIEAMAQVGGLLIVKALGATEDMTPFFMSIDKVKFRKVVRPGDQLRIEIKITKLRGSRAVFEGKVYVDGKVVSQAEMMCMLVKGDK